MSHNTILLVEDNPSDIALTKRALARCGIANRLVIAEDGNEAIEYLWGSQASGDVSELPALTLLDLKLPRVPGLEILRRIRQDARTRRLPVVILTSSVEEQDVAAGYDLGINSYIQKPIDFSEFSRTLEQLGLYWLILNEPPPPVK